MADGGMIVTGSDDESLTRKTTLTTTTRTTVTAARGTPMQTCRVTAKSTRNPPVLTTATRRCRPVRGSITDTSEPNPEQEHDALLFVFLPTLLNAISMIDADRTRFHLVDLSRDRLRRESDGVESWQKSYIRQFIRQTYAIPTPTYHGQ